jgi:hypothetical protein
MNRSRAKELLPAIEYWANGGNVWWYNKQGCVWRLHLGEMSFTSAATTMYVIEDKHFEARKAYALGEEIECRHTCNAPWFTMVGTPLWFDTYDYQPKPKVKQMTLKEATEFISNSLDTVVEIIGEIDE